MKKFLFMVLVCFMALHAADGNRSSRSNSCATVVRWGARSLALAALCLGATNVEASGGSWACEKAGSDRWKILTSNDLLQEGKDQFIAREYPVLGSTFSCSDKDGKVIGSCASLVQAPLKDFSPAILGLVDSWSKMAHSDVCKDATKAGVHSVLVWGSRSGDWTSEGRFVYPDTPDEEVGYKSRLFEDVLFDHSKVYIVFALQNSTQVEAVVTGKNSIILTKKRD